MRAAAGLGDEGCAVVGEEDGDVVDLAEFLAGGYSALRVRSYQPQPRRSSTAFAVAMSVTRSVTRWARRIADKAGTFSAPKALTMTWVIDGIRSIGIVINPWQKSAST